MYGQKTTNFSWQECTEAELDNESINAIVKAKSALVESETVVIKPTSNADGEFQLELEFGGNVEYANKVSFYIPNVSTSNTPEEFKVHYNSGMIKEIMYCNKDMVKGHIAINLDGLMKLEFENENLKSRRNPKNKSSKKRGFHKWSN